MKCAVVQTFNNVVLNVIVADPSVDPAPESTIFVGLPDDSSVSIGWIYDPTTGQFTDPNPPEEIIRV